MSLNGLTFEMDELNTEGKSFNIKLKIYLFLVSRGFPHEIITDFPTEILIFIFMHEFSLLYPL